MIRPTDSSMVFGRRQSVRTWSSDSAAICKNSQRDNGQSATQTLGKVSPAELLSGECLKTPFCSIPTAAENKEEREIDGPFFDGGADRRTDADFVCIYVEVIDGHK